MKAIHWITAAAALAFVQPTSVSAAQSDPEVLIYRFPGVADNGGAMNAGVATSFHCTNFSGELETIRVVVRNHDTTILGNTTSTASHLGTVTISTHFTALYNNENILGTGTVAQGTGAIAATSINIICTAVTIDAGATLPNGFALRGIRFNPAPGSQE